jgi:hypothetical protein
MKDLTFEQLMVKSNKTLDSLKKGNDCQNEILELMNEFHRRLSKESNGLQIEIGDLKRKLGIPTLKIVD